MPSNLASLVRTLQQRKGRKRHRLAVAEGVRLVEEALSSEITIRGVITAESFRDSGRAGRLLRDLAAQAVPIEEVSDRTLAGLADTDTPQGILAVVEPPGATLASITAAPGAPVIVLDGVQDPGNVGTLLRTAFALGAGGAVLLKGTADPLNAKVIRAGMGATFRLPIAQADEAEFRAWVVRTRPAVWAASMGGTPVARLQRPERLVLIVGSEGAGLRPEVASLATDRVGIPLTRGAESLNVSVAAGIILNEVRRGA
jgi:TrmH family RNA methyltransferase